MKRCPVTDLPIANGGGSTYQININGEALYINVGMTFENFSRTKLFLDKKYIIAGAIINKQLSSTDDFYSFDLTEDNLKKAIPRIIYPKYPKDKLDNLFKTLYELQEYDGELVTILELTKNPEFYYKHFFRSMKECNYYIQVLHHQGLIELTLNNLGLPMEFRILYKGLDYYLTLTVEGNASNRCFVAMSFDPKMYEIREAIKSVLIANDFVPILIDEQLIECGQTINDAIVAAIKSCKFCVADFSQQKDGVYFESGFAVGLGKHVIYTCQKNWFEKSHFDTNHFPHLIYNTENELKEMLDKRIKAWIK